MSCELSAVTNQLSEMLVKCRFSSCTWSGSEDDIFSHCETHHSHWIRELKGRNYFEFTFDDLQRECFVLCGKSGLYWFSLSMDPAFVDGEEVIQRGVFHIGHSEPIEYNLVLGSLRELHKERIGPYTSRAEPTSQKQTEVYDLVFPDKYLEFINEAMPSRQLRLCIGEIDDSDDQIWPTCDMMTWEARDEEINQVCIERFTCPICLEYIQRNARFCENEHFVCLPCFTRMLERKRLQCPVCRGDYLYDCSSEAIERLLGMIKWPAKDEVSAGSFQETAPKRFKRC